MTIDYDKLVAPEKDEENIKAPAGADIGAYVHCEGLRREGWNACRAETLKLLRSELPKLLLARAEAAREGKNEVVYRYQGCCEKCAEKVLPQIDGTRYICKNAGCECHKELASSLKAEGVVKVSEVVEAIRKREKEWPSFLPPTNTHKLMNEIILVVESLQTKREQA